MIFVKKHIKEFLALTASLLMMSCISEVFEVPNEENNSNTKDGYALSLTVELPVMDTRAGADFEKYEDYIDMSNIRLLFFKAQGTDASGNNDFSVDPSPNEITLFRDYKGSDLIFTPIDLSTETYHKKWHVNIPLDTEDEEDLEFIETIRNYDFKIAVLANWPQTDEMSIGDPINKLHHLAKDNYSDDKKSGSSQKNSNKDTYSFLFTDTEGKMGLTTNWVKPKMPESDWGFELTDENAAGWIRKNWDPSLDKNKKEGPYQYETYSDLWFLWNFGGDNETHDNALKYSYSASKWETRNGKNLREWITKNIQDNEEEGNLEDLDEITTSDDSNDQDLNYLQFKTIDGAKGLKKSLGNGSYNYGILLPYAQPKEGNSGMKIEDPGVISFIARATGTLTIWARHGGGQYTNSQGNASAAKIVVQRGISGEKDEFNYYADSEESAEITSISKRINITGDEERLFIYNGSTNSSDINRKNKVEIYQIEYIQDKYLYDTDRVGKTPEELNIPMYGVQKFGALKDVWKEGTVFDLSNFDGQASSSYEYSDIYLLRSVAKVELLIPKSFDPHHVVLRSQNRTARTEPMDVFTNTRDIWADGSLNSGTDNHKSNSNCEWSSLRTKMENSTIAPFYNPEGNLQSYQTSLKWYYGSWDNVTASGSDFPHILNPMINRSDFTDFIYTGEEGIYKRYVLYVPEKFVDDPNEPGDPTEIPKVCHIEFRVTGDSFTNIDDNNCYRLYFTENGANSEYVKNVTFTKPEGAEKYQTWETEYEQQVDNLRKHWPIMRNHCYRFTVAPGNNNYISADVKVLSWKQLDVSIYW